MHLSTTIPLPALAEALGAEPDDIRLALDLAERLGALQVLDGRVRLPAHVVALLGLEKDGDRWVSTPDPRNPPGRTGPARRAAAGRQRGSKGPLSLTDARSSAVPDHRASEPWQELSRAEDPPPNRVESVARWLDRQGTTARPPAGPGGDPSAPRRPRDATARPPALRLPESPGPSGRVKPCPPPSSFSLAALRARLDAAGRVAV